MKEVVFAGLLTAWAACGCGAPRQSDTARTAVERLLLSTAADRAAKALNVEVLDGKKVFLDVSHFEANDKAYAIGAIRDQLGGQGVLLVNDAKEAEVVAEVRAGALDTDSSTSFIGLPSIPIVVPGAGTITTPELALFKKSRQYGTAKIALNALDSKSGRQIYSTAPQRGQSFFTRWTFLLFITFHTTDIQEVKWTSY